MSITAPKWLAEELVKKKEEPERLRSVSMGRGLKTVELKKETNAFVAVVGGPRLEIVAESCDNEHVKK